MQVNIRGVEETIENIRVFGDIAHNELGLKMLEVVEDVMMDARFYAPVRSGHLKDHIKGRVVKAVRGIVIIGRVHSTARYSIFQEFGTTRHAAHPFMRPALNKNRFNILDKLGQAMDIAIEKASVGKFYASLQTAPNVDPGRIEGTVF